MATEGFKRKLTAILSAEYFGKQLKYKNDEDKELFLNGLRKAGLN